MAFWAVKIGFSWFPIDGPVLDLQQRGELELPQTPAAFNTSIFSRITIKKLIQTLCVVLISYGQTLFLVLVVFCSFFLVFRNIFDKNY